jgi:hypothetical protein
MKAWLVTIALLAGTFAHAQDQSSCPAPRQPEPATSCSNRDVDRNLTVRVQGLLTRYESHSGAHSPPDSVGYDMMHSKLTPELASDPIERVQEHPYRFCDIGLETRRVDYSVEKEIEALSLCGLPHTYWIAKTFQTASPQLP